MLCDKCQNIITPERECPCLSEDEWMTVKEIKHQYRINNLNPTNRGLAIYVWHTLISFKQDNEKVMKENKGLWENKAKDIASAVFRVSDKFENEIEKLKIEIARLEHINANLRGFLGKPISVRDNLITEPPKNLTCSQCGAKTGCYCK